MSAPENIIDRLNKLKEMYRRGTCHESDTAYQLMIRLCDKYNVDINHILENEQTKEYHFRYDNEYELRLLRQIIVSINDTINIMYYTNRNTNYRVRIIICTDYEYVLLSEQYAIYRAALKKELKKVSELAYKAFVHTNDIFSRKVEEEHDDVPKQKSTLSFEERMLISQMMSNMDKVEIQKKLS